MYGITWTWIYHQTEERWRQNHGATRKSTTVFFQIFHWVSVEAIHWQQEKREKKEKNKKKRRTDLESSILVRIAKRKKRDKGASGFLEERSLGCRSRSRGPMFFSLSLVAHCKSKRMWWGKVFPKRGEVKFKTDSRGEEYLTPTHFTRLSQGVPSTPHLHFAI